MGRPNGPHAAFQLGVADHDRQMARIQRQAMSQRQLELSRYWSFYETEQYAARTVGWDGRRVLGDVERENIARTMVLPQGFWDPSGQADDLPLSMRKPTAPYHLVRAVVNRFSGLLFSAKRHPTVTHRNEQVQKWIAELVKACRLWIRMAHARTHGGGMGAAVVTFSFQGGRPVVEVHDARWCTPQFINMTTGEVSSVEIRYMYPVEETGPDGILREVFYWYRRTIDVNSDVLYKAAPLGEGDEPFWEEAQRVDHGLGEFPGVWIRNTLTNQQDGDPDCMGEFDTQEAIDRLLSQADQGAVENCDPTLLLESDQLKLSGLKKGSRNALQLEKGGGGSYLEINGTGIDSALKMADRHRANFLEVVQCVLDNTKEGGPKTATEIERLLESMHERGDMFREQYGECGVKPLIAKMVRAAIKVRTTGPIDPETGLRLVGVVSLPPQPGPDGEPVELELPPGITTITADELDLTWPEWVQRGPADASAAAGAVSTARSCGALALEDAIAYLAPFFSIDDIVAAIGRARAEAGATDAAMMDDMAQRQAPDAPAAPGQPTPGAPGDPAAGGAAPAPAGPAAAGTEFNGAQIQAATAIMIAIGKREMSGAGGALMLTQFCGVPADIAQQMTSAQEALAASSPPPAAPGAGGPPWAR
jgi:hypothetical protein